MDHLSATGSVGKGRTVLVLAILGALAGACGAPGVGEIAPATDAEWRTLATPRPTPLPGAPRLSLSTVQLLGDPPWTGEPLPDSLGLAGLVVAGLLRRPDVQFVERRRFAAAIAAERSGARRPPGAPAAGISPGAELTASVAWVPLTADRASVEVRLADAETGAVVQTNRALVPEEAEPVGLARTIVAAILTALDDLGQLPAWTDPLPGAAPRQYVDSGVPARAVADFMAGLAAEDGWNWERARQAYQVAAESVGFFEAAVALSRAARLRLGGTLGES